MTTLARRAARNQFASTPSDDDYAEYSDEELAGNMKNVPILDGRNSATSASSKTSSDEDNDDSERTNFEMERREMPERVSLNEEFAVPHNCNTSWGEELEGGVCESLCALDDPDPDPFEGCAKFNACVCGKCLGADRVGNMPVLWARRRPGKPTQLLCLVGPFWPCMVGVTYPLILGISLMSALYQLPYAPWWVVALWVVCTFTLVVSLGLTACSDPGIVPRHKDSPPAGSTGWRWSDQANTYRPPGATYDRDCGVVIEEFDHTCPWTGTGIGRANMPYFRLPP